MSDHWFEKTGIRIIDGIGATEMIHIFIAAEGEDIRPGSTGKPLPGYRACVLDEDFHELPRGSTGRGLSLAAFLLASVCRSARTPARISTRVSEVRTRAATDPQGD